jgi:hypothetical protein
MESIKAVLTDNIIYHIKANHTPLPDKKPVKYQQTHIIKMNTTPMA